jgi:formylglycine-generating enzyme required for sulfatase activity
LFDPGNVQEWCLDWYGKYPGGAVVDPVGAPSGSDRINRGGGWWLVADGCCPGLRRGAPPANRYYSFGFRLALSPVRKGVS